jgi:hypothetical protein
MDQKRAAVGGELGANGEWYEGGKFIATKENPKSSPVRFELSAAEMQAKADREAAEMRLQEWLSSRRAALALAISALLAYGAPDDVFENFHHSLGRQRGTCAGLRPMLIFQASEQTAREGKQESSI